VKLSMIYFDREAYTQEFKFRFVKLEGERVDCEAKMVSSLSYVYPHESMTRNEAIAHFIELLIASWDEEIAEIEMYKTKVTDILNTKTF